MKTLTLISTLAVLLCSPLSLRAEDQGRTFIGSMAALKTADIVVPVSAPAAVKEEAPAKEAGVKESYDPEMGKKLAAAAAAGNIGAFKGKCYTYVARHMDAAGILGFNDWVAMGIQPGYSADAADFAVWAAANQEKMRREMKLAILPTPENKEEVPLGSILVYDRGYCDFSSDSGHIEVLTAQDKACSDGCEGLDQKCFADPDIRAHVHVIVPVKE